MSFRHIRRFTEQLEASEGFLHSESSSDEAESKYPSTPLTFQQINLSLDSDSSTDELPVAKAQSSELEPGQSILSDPPPFCQKKKKRKGSKKNPAKLELQTRDKQQTESVWITNSAEQSHRFTILPQRFDYKDEEEFLKNFTPLKGRKRKSLRLGSVVPFLATWSGLPLKGFNITSSFSSQHASYGRYVYNESYSALTTEFYNLCQHRNEEKIIAFLEKHPYHVESLFRLAFLMRIKEGDPHIYCELIERGLYLLTHCTHPGFDFYSKKAHLSYRVYQNRSFHLFLFVHMLNLEDRCCYKACLECCKLLLNLDPSDPLGVLCWFDFFCIKSKAYKLLVEFVDSDENNFLKSLPNMRFSYAISQHYLQNIDASASLTAALVDFPAFFSVLSKKVNGLVPYDVIQHPLFCVDETKVSPVLVTLIGIYVTKLKFLLRNEDILNLFLSSARTCMRLYDGGLAIPTPGLKKFTTYPKSILRYSYLTYYSDPHVDKDMAHQGIVVFPNDPYSPKKGANPYVLPVLLVCVYGVKTKSQSINEPSEDPFLALIFAVVSRIYNIVCTLLRRIY